MWAIVVAIFNSSFKNIKYVFNKEDKRQISHGGTIQKFNNGKQSVFPSFNFLLPCNNKLFINCNVPAIFPYTRCFGSHYQTQLWPSISKPFILNSYTYPHSHFYLPIFLMSNKNKEKDKSVQSKPPSLQSPTTAATTTSEIETNMAR